MSQVGVAGLGQLLQARKIATRSGAMEIGLEVQDRRGLVR